MLYCALLLLHHQFIRNEVLLSDFLKITPIGGVAQIGSNMTLVSTEKSNIIIDCGILFPYEDVFDINYLIPDLNYYINKIKKNNLEIDAIIFTHGHEDHIGAVTHISSLLPQTPIYASPFTKELIVNKLHLSGMKRKIHTIGQDTLLQYESLNVEFVHVNHSIPDTFGIILSSKHLDTSIFYCSDFKVDSEDYLEEKMDLHSLSKKMSTFSRKILLTDSTNILSDQLKTLSEKELYSDLKIIIKKAPSRVFITSFASNIHRMQTIFNIAKSLNKKVVLYGRSMKKYAELAIQCGHLDTYRLERDVASLDCTRSDLIILTSGCQGDFKSATRRICVDEDSYFKLKSNDYFLFSSKSIPGNEKKIGILMNALAEKNVTIYDSNNSKIHASGHAGRDDLALLYDTINPQYIFPIHGESLFLKAHREFIEKNYPQAKTNILYNGYTIHIEKSSLKIKEDDAASPVIIHGKGIEIDRKQISQRRKVAQTGIIIISIAKKNKGLDFKMESLGIPPELLPDEKKVNLIIRSSLNLKSAEEDIRIKVRNLMKVTLGYKPVTIVFIHFGSSKASI